ncbi:MAG: Asp-tRNA(Asn)/Glu-tRNA(Gln) amidotransferase subunit GatB, partial [Acetobacteraceae bacterium]
NWIVGDLFAALNRSGRTIADSPVSADSLGRMLDLLADGTINGRIAKDLFEAMVETGEDPNAIVERRGLRQVTDAGAIEAAVASILAEEAEKVAEYRAGKERLFGFFVGRVMKAMAGKGNPALINETLRRQLS